MKEIQTFWLSLMLEKKYLNDLCFHSFEFFQRKVLCQIFSFSDVSTLPETKAGVVIDISISLYFQRPEVRDS